MKQIAFALAALLSTSVLAKRHFSVQLSYKEQQDISLDLEVGNEAKVKLPCAGRRKNGCEGWKLAEDNEDFIDFTVEKMEEKKKRRKSKAIYIFNAFQATELDSQEVMFENTCKQDENGDNVRWSVWVTSYANEEDEDEDMDE